MADRPYGAFRAAALLALLALGLGGCGSFEAATFAPKRVAATDERECLARAMYFESNRSSDSGQLAVGTVVMNRLEDPRYPKTICGVVGQKNQFAPGVLTEPMTSRATPRVFAVADRVLDGERHPGVGTALHFHTAGYSFPYRNMHYVAMAGGNAFYEKRQNPTQTQIMVAALAEREKREAAREGREADPAPIPALKARAEPARVQIARAEPEDEAEEAPVRAAPAPRIATPARVEAPVRAEPAPIRLAAAPRTVRTGEPTPKPVLLARAEPARASRADAMAPQARPSRLLVASAELGAPGRKGAAAPPLASGRSAIPTPPARNMRDLLAKYDGKALPPAKPVRLSARAT